MIDSPFLFFTDAVLRAPTIGCMFMCTAAALVGVIVFLKKQSLLGEALSHAAYPGVISGVLAVGALQFSQESEFAIALLIMLGAFISALAGLWAIAYLERQFKVRSDSALCFILSVFFGIGLTLASQVQFAYSSFYRLASVYLYGQAATMTDVHILIYGLLSLLVCLLLALFYKEIKTIVFDRDYACSIGINVRAFDASVFILIVLAVIIGIRSVGVVLMSAMLIAPAAAARQYTNKLHWMLLLAVIFGVASAFIGNYLSVEVSKSIAETSSGSRLTLPTGPMIVITASVICLLSLMFAPERGVIVRLARIARFRYRCLCENLLKAIWRMGLDQEVSFEEIAKHQSVSSLYLRFILTRLASQGWIIRTNAGYRLTHEGSLWAARIVRLHRLWEVYLADYIGVGVEKVHRSAEEMEHIITPELERELTLLLKNPKRDPHDQPIPSTENE